MEWLTEPSGIAVVSVDWFGISCQLAAPYDGRPLMVPKGWQVQECSSTAVWARRWFVLSQEGVKIATILCTPRSTAIPPCSAMVEIANIWLYHEAFSDIVPLVLNVLPMVPTGMNRVDLCCDFEMDVSKWIVFRYLEDGQCYLKGLQQGVVWWQREVKNRIPHQLSWGGKESKFHWKVYYKYKELHQGGSCSKPYIEDMWRSVGMDPKMVWRCEVSISHANGIVDKETEKPVPMMDWYNRRDELYRRIYGDKFVVRMNEGHKDKRNDPEVRFLDIKGMKLLKHKISQGSEIESDVERRIVCKLWKEFIDPEVRANDFAKEGLREHLMYMFQRARNVGCVARRFKLTEAEVMNAIVDAQQNCL